MSSYLVFFYRIVYIDKLLDIVDYNSYPVFKTRQPKVPQLLFDINKLLI